MKNFLNDIKGIAAIETAMLLFPFLVFVTILVEVLLLVYTSVAIDYVNSQAATYASSFFYKENYLTKYKEELDRQRQKIGFFLTDGSFDISIAYCNDLNELSKEKCESNNDESIINLYELTYRVRTIFLFNWIEKGKVLKSKLAYYNERHGKND
ncbi:pilus assembly protein [Campylobacter sp. RM9334]|uniref:TadE/TadG family type IV pilus assembly protein n=1 Tax=Campylobacter sp. RM9334 TaxID=2735732 RepID=UPI001D6B88BA|nr:pilus assembly protein [Campylobacter sp. RM9334]